MLELIAFGLIQKHSLFLIYGNLNEKVAKKSNVNNIILPLSSYSFTYQSKNTKYYFSFCENLQAQCKGYSTQFSNTDQSNCILYSGASSLLNKWELLDSSNPNAGWKISLNSGQECNTSNNYTIIYELRCDNTEQLNNKKYILDNDSNFDPMKCLNIWKFRTKHACLKADFYQIWKFIQDKKVFFASAIIIFGLFGMTMGKYYDKITAYVISCISIITIVFILMFQYIIPNGTNEIVVWIFLFLSIICGLIMGYFVAKNKQGVLGIILGLYSGYILGQIWYQTLLRSIEWHPIIVRYLCYAICIIIFCGISFYIYKHIIIISTSFCGSYAVIRGVSIFAGGFPNESTIIDLINSKEYAQLEEILSFEVYVYLVAFIISFVGSCYFQYRINRSKKDIEREREKRRNKITGDDEMDTKNYFKLN